MTKDKKIYKLNASGTVGVSLTKSMKEAGYIEGKRVEWEALNDGFLLKLVKAPLTPSEPVVEAKSEPSLETL